VIDKASRPGCSSARESLLIKLNLSRHVSPARRTIRQLARFGAIFAVDSACNFRHCGTVESRDILDPDHAGPRAPAMTMKFPRAATVLVASLLTVPVALLAADGAKTAQLPTPPQSDKALLKSVDAKTLPNAPTTDQTTAAKLVYGLLSDSRYAYRPRALDDTLSADMYKRYLEALDGGKQFFTAQDIARFDAYKFKFDDAIKSGNLDPAYAIFGTYRQRFDARVTYARNLLKQDIFTFTGSDRFEYDREDAPWVADEAALDALWKQTVRNDWLRLQARRQEVRGHPQDARQALRQHGQGRGRIEGRGRLPDVPQQLRQCDRSAHRLLHPAHGRQLQHEHVAVAGGHRRGAAEAGRRGRDPRDRAGWSRRQVGQAQAWRPRGRPSARATAA
jgi:hypothetical protein